MFDVVHVSASKHRCLEVVRREDSDPEQCRLHYVSDWAKRPKLPVLRWVCGSSMPVILIIEIIKFTTT